MLGLIIVMINIVQKLNLQLPIFPTIQKPYYRQSADLTMVGFVESLRPEKFSGVNFKIWKSKVRLWFTAMHIWDTRLGKPEGDLSAEEQKKFYDANNLFVGCIISNLSDGLVRVYIEETDAKTLWDALVAKYDATDASNELYLMESFHDYRMVNNRSVVEQAHEVQRIVKDLDLLKCPIPDKFVDGCIIAKLPSTWRNFATSLKHKRQEISVANLIGTIDVEEKARKKDTDEKGHQGQSSANMIQKFSRGKNNKGKNKPVKTSTFKKKRNKADMDCFACGKAGDFSKECPDRADRRAKKAEESKDVNMVTIGNTEDGYDNLPTILSVFQTTSWWLDTGAHVHVCVDVSLFSSYQLAQGSTVLMGNGSHASVRGVGTVDLKFTSGKIVQHVPTINKNLVSGSVLCKDGFKVVLESSKFVMSKHRQFVGKCYDCGGLFQFSLADFCISL
jgi:hypothetical protein